LKKIWEERKVPLPDRCDPESLVLVPESALYYAALGCVDIARGEANGVGIYHGRDRLDWWVRGGQYEQKKKQGRQGLWRSKEDVEEFHRRYHTPRVEPDGRRNLRLSPTGEPIQCLVGCDFGSTTAKAVCLSLDKEILFTCYALSEGNPIE